MRPLSAVDLVLGLAHALSASKVPVLALKVGCSGMQACTVGLLYLHRHANCTD